MYGGLTWPGGSVGQSVVPYTTGCGFNSWSGHIPRLWVQSPVRAYMGSNRSMFLSCIRISVSLSLPSSFSKVNEHRKKEMYGEGLVVMEYQLYIRARGVLLSKWKGHLNSNPHSHLPIYPSQSSLSVKGRVPVVTMIKVKYFKLVMRKKILRIKLFLCWSMPADCIWLKWRQSIKYCSVLNRIIYPDYAVKAILKISNGLLKLCILEIYLYLD